MERELAEEQMMVTDFQKEVYSLTSKVPRGKVTTYGAIAKKLGASPRAVGQALRANPYAPRVPCHRVVRSDRSIGGFRGKISGKAIDEKIAMLRKEQVLIDDMKIRKEFIINRF
jgi:methylated-DNA-[protein]-cysteine S-methyltransferase